MDNYWIRANPVGTAIAGFSDGINSAILRYVGAPDEEPAVVDPPESTNPLNEVNLHPLSLFAETVRGPDLSLAPH